MNYVFFVTLSPKSVRMRSMWMMIFMVLPILAFVYIAWHVWAILPLAAKWKALIILVALLSFLLLFYDLRGRLDSYPLPLAKVFYEIGTSSVIIMLYLVIVFLVLDAGRLFHIIPNSLVHANWQMAAGIFVFLFAVFLYGHLHYINKVRVPLEIKSSKPLSREYKVVMASDLHLGYHNTRKDLAHWVDLMNAENPDFILIAGDIIDMSVRPLLEEKMAEEFHRLKAPVYACLGNHEYFSGEPRAKQFYHDAGIRLLIDSAAVVDSTILIVGRDDRMNFLRKPLEDLMASAGSSLPFTILLDHQPYHLDHSEKAGIDFQLSGHTHRGQVWPISWITDAVYEKSWGSYRRGDTQYYITSGLGIWGGKFRIGTQSEYIVATIHN